MSRFLVGRKSWERETLSLTYRVRDALAKVSFQAPVSHLERQSWDGDSGSVLPDHLVPPSHFISSVEIIKPLDEKLPELFFFMKKIFCD